MFRRSITWFICTFVAVAIAADYGGIDSNTESSTADPLQKPSTSVVLEALLDAGERADVAGDRRLLAHRADSPAETSSPALEEMGASFFPTTRPHSDLSGHSDHQTPATATPTEPAQTITSTTEDDFFRPRELTQGEKNSKLMEAARVGAVGRVEAMLAAGADLWSTDSWNRTYLHYAAQGGHEEAARRLLAAGVPVDARHNSEWTALHEAASGGHAAVVRLLLDHGADHTARDKEWQTPLHLAVLGNHNEAAAALLEAGADSMATDIGRVTPLGIATRRKNQELVKLMQRYSGMTSKYRGLK